MNPNARLAALAAAFAVLLAPAAAGAEQPGAPGPGAPKVDAGGGDGERQPDASAGGTHFAMGFVAVAPPLDHALTPAPGIDLDVHYGSADRRLEVGGSVRFGASGGNAGGDRLNGFFIASAGGRFYPSGADFSPYVGGGLAFSFFDLSLASLEGGMGAGPGAYLDAGIEVLRTHPQRIAVGARLDLPFYAMGPSGVCGDCGAAPGKLYYAPLSLEARFTF